MSFSKPTADRLNEISKEFDAMIASESESSEVKRVTRVKKRDGNYEPVYFDKIRVRIEKFSDDLNVDSFKLAQEIISRIYDGIETRELDVLAARKAHNRNFQHPDWDRLASRIAVSNHHKETVGVFTEVIYELHKQGRISDELFCIVQDNEEELDKAIDYNRDFALSYIGFQYFYKSYAMRTRRIVNGEPQEGVIIERPQDMMMRVALGIHKEDLDAAIETYNFYSCLYFTHASPTIFNAGTPKPQCSSCFLIAMKEEETYPHDSLEKIYETLTDAALISKHAGGEGLSISNVRPAGSMIRSVGRPADGLVPMLRVFNDTARYANQGGKRKGAFAMYLEPWHPDIIEFLQLRKNEGNHEQRARDLHYAMWIPDIFMERCENDEIWSMIDPMECPELYKTHGDEFRQHYLRCEKEGNYMRQMPARKLLFEIIVAQIETGEPYMLYKDHCNRKSNQKNLGTIRSSNLCAEIIEYSDSNEQAVCNLASLCLPSFVEQDPETEVVKFNHMMLYEATKILTRNLNKVIDINFYPTKETKVSNMRHRPIGIGIQGLADTFMKFHYPFESAEASKLNHAIFETIYYAALEASCELAETDGTYESYEGCPVSQGILQFDMWDGPSGLTDRWNWTKLRLSIKKHGLRNSLLVALMPTASTSMLMGFSESFEPYTSNYYTINSMYGSFKRINKYLILDMINLGLWNKTMQSKVIGNNGSLQGLPSVPKHIQDLYKTVWEIPQKTLIDLAAERSKFIDQSQSFNVYMTGFDRENKDDMEDNEKKSTIVSKMSSLHMYTWKKGLKTGQYYLRTRPAVDPQKFTLAAQIPSRNAVKETEVASPLLPADSPTNSQPEDEDEDEDQVPGLMCINKDDCEMCGA